MSQESAPIPPAEAAQSWAVSLSKFLFLNEIAEIVDRVCKVWLSFLGALAIGLSGAGRSTVGIDQTNNHVGFAQNMVGATRFTFVVAEIATNRFFHRYDEETGKLVLHDPYTIAMKVTVAPARFLSPVTFLHSAGLINLGKHFSRMGQAICSFFTLATFFQVAQSIRDFFHATTNRARVVADLMVAILDTLGSLCELGLQFTRCAVLAIFSALCAAASGIAYIFVNHVAEWRDDKRTEAFIAVLKERRASSWKACCTAAPAA